MLTNMEKIDLSHFKAAKDIALEIKGDNLRTRASASHANPFYGARLKEVGPCVIWREAETHLTDAKWRLKIELDNEIWYAIPVTFYTILNR